MLNPRAYFNSRPDGIGVLEVVSDNDTAARRFAPLRRTDLAGSVAGPLATLTLTQTFALDGPPDGNAVEALYRFPLPGDAAVTGVRVAFGDVVIATTLKERPAAARRPLA
jgi:Ca-activated chloride channel homolog